MFRGQPAKKFLLAWFAVACGGSALLLVGGCRGAAESSDPGAPKATDAGASTNSPSSAQAGASGQGGAGQGDAAASQSAGNAPDAVGAGGATAEAGAGPGSNAPTLKGHWVALGAPRGVQIGALAWSEDGTLFAGSSDSQWAVGGLFASSDRGASWRLASKGITTAGTSSIVATGSQLFAAVGYTLYRSADYGLSWQNITGISAYTVGAQASLVAVADPYYALSTDGGQTFAKGSGNLGATSDSVAVLGDVVLRVTGGLLTRSADRGATFGSVQLPATVTFSNVSLKCDRTKTCYAAASAASQLYRSTDAGASWSALGRDLDRVLVVTDEGSVYIQNTSGEVERSDDGGASWEKCPKPSDGNCAKGILVARGDQAFVPCDEGVFRSDDRGRHWTLTTGSGAQGALIDVATMLLVDRTSTASSPNGDLYVSAPQARNSKLWASADDGQSWSARGYASPAACTISDRHTLVCAWASRTPLMRSEDHGATWTLGTTAVQGGTVVAAGSSGLYVAGDGKFGGFARSDDDGLTFAFVDDIASYTTGLQVLKSGHVLRFSGRTSKSVDRGETWNDCSWLTTRLPIPEDADGRLYLMSGGQLRVSSDEGDSWTPLADSPTGSTLGVLFVRDGRGRFYTPGRATASDAVIYFKDDSSSTWGSFPAPPSPFVQQFAFDNRERLLAATTAGVYRFDPE